MQSLVEIASFPAMFLLSGHTQTHTTSNAKTITATDEKKANKQQVLTTSILRTKSASVRLKLPESSLCHKGAACSEPLQNRKWTNKKTNKTCDNAAFWLSRTLQQLHLQTVHSNFIVHNTERAPADVILEDLEKEEAGGGEIQNVEASVPPQYSVSTSVPFPSIFTRLTPPTHSKLSSFSHMPLFMQEFALSSATRAHQTVTSWKRFAQNAALLSHSFWPQEGGGNMNMTRRAFLQESYSESHDTAKLQNHRLSNHLPSCLPFQNNIPSVQNAEMGQWIKWIAMDRKTKAR